MMLRTTILGLAVGAAATAAAACAPGATDATAASESAVVGDCPEPTGYGAVPADLACTGLYADGGTKTLGAGVRGFIPAVPFWSDGFEKERWIQLPDGTTIDGTNQDDWRFPTGTKAWKEIRKGTRKIETRYFWKAAEGDWRSAAYVWSEDGTRATRHDGGDLTVDGAPYHVPSIDECASCHSGREDRLLGFEALSLALPGAEGVTLATLAAENRIQPAPARTSVTLPDPAYAALHINCGVSCHNANPNAGASWTELKLRLGFDEVATKPTTEWDTFKTSVGVPTMREDRGPLRVKPGLPKDSAIYTAMNSRGDAQMPPLATTVVDDKSVAIVEAWIKSLPAAPVP